ncbi:hypothetical protein HDU82_004079 [Entophlyctis luteolus]|nr:hypothetical protein HDU82_004079 [Entophlyctis luteolus]
MLPTILASGAFDVEPWRPGPRDHGRRADETRRLQNIMAGTSEVGEETQELSNCKKRTISCAAKAAENHGYEDVDEFDMVYKEIEDRKQWLDDMIALGRGDVYRRQIQNEIAVRIKRLELLDRARNSSGENSSWQ